MPAECERVPMTDSREPRRYGIYPAKLLDADNSIIVGPEFASTDEE